MNRLNLIPDDAPEFAFIRRMEILGRCTHFAMCISKCQTLADEIAAAPDLPVTTRAERLAYVAAVIRKLRQQHRETHLCYPFSLN